MVPLLQEEIEQINKAFIESIKALNPFATYPLGQRFLQMKHPFQMCELCYSKRNNILKTGKPLHQFLEVRLVLFVSCPVLISLRKNKSPSELIRKIILTDDYHISRKLHIFTLIDQLERSTTPDQSISFVPKSLCDNFSLLQPTDTHYLKQLNGIVWNTLPNLIAHRIHSTTKKPKRLFYTNWLAMKIINKKFYKLLSNEASHNQLKSDKFIIIKTIPSQLHPFLYMASPSYPLYYLERSIQYSFMADSYINKIPHTFLDLALELAEIRKIKLQINPISFATF